MLTTDVLIIGAGPIGLFLGCRLAQLGISFKIIEKRRSRFLHSRSIGIHPPSLEKLEPLGVVEEILQRGIKVERGHGFINTNYLGVLDFTACPKPYNFVVSLPQFETEAILEKRLCELASTSLLRGLEVTSLQQSEGGVVVKVQSSENSNLGEPPTNLQLSAKFVVGCDGKDSIIRQLAGIAFHGGTYPDTYLMGDFADTTNFGTDAAIYLTDDGLVESFPLTSGVRRWVAKTDERVLQPSAEGLAQLIQGRLNHTLPVTTNAMLSSFGVQRYLAARFVKNRVLLAGDAAHVVSPMGGQGMNLGWLDAWDAAEALKNILKNREDALLILQKYDLGRKRAARIALSRAAFNMRMGRKTRFAPVKYALARVLIKQPFATGLAKLFTMRGL
jgi:2-polyprenyl-6-methoxyphenol hydroxylase-like FAD-dependent oxidoreductase